MLTYRGQVDRAALDALLRQHLPGYAGQSIAALGEGQQNAAYEVGSDLVVRVSKVVDPIERQSVVDREARLLDIVGQYTTLPIPRPLFAADGVMAYRKVPGLPLLAVAADRRLAHGVSIARTVGRFLAEIQAISGDLVADLVGTDDDDFPRWMADAADCATAIAARDAVLGRRWSRRTPAIESFLASVPPDPRPQLVFSHNDLGNEHVLVDPAHPCGHRRHRCRRCGDGGSGVRLRADPARSRSGGIRHRGPRS